MIKNGFYILLVLILNAACGTGQNKSTELTEDTTPTSETNFDDSQENGIVGTWINSTIDVDLSTYNNSDTSFHVAITEDNWELKMNIKPVETTLNEDGTFINKYLDTLGNVFHSNSGIWYIDGDSLFLEEENGTVYPFEVKINGNFMEMHTIVDYDEDGMKDDNYFGTYKRLKD